MAVYSFMDENLLFNNPNRARVPLPKIPFEGFYKKFKRVSDIVKTPEWKEIYSNYYSFTPEELAIEMETKEEIDAYDEDRQYEELTKCVWSFEYFCHKYAKIVHPIYGLIPCIPYTYQRNVCDCYTKHRFNIMSKFRQGGLTTISVIWSLWRCLFMNDQRIMVMSKTDREAIAAGGIAKTVLQYLPKWLTPVMAEDNKHERNFAENNSILWFCGPDAARGKSTTILIVDEAAFIEDMDEYWAAMYPVISTGGACEIISTVNGMGNWYEEIYHKTEAGLTPFNLITIDYWEHPLYNDNKWLSDTYANLGHKRFMQEVCRSFLGSGETYIDQKIIGYLEATTRDNQPLKVSFPELANLNEGDHVENWGKGALWLWKTPQEGHEYIIGADVANGVGSEGDNCCFQVLDMMTAEQVAEFYSNLVKPNYFAKILSQIGIYYNTALIVVENAGDGGVVIDDLHYELRYENIYSDKGDGRLGIKPNRSNRPEYLETLQTRLDNNTVKINSRRFVKEIRTFIYNRQKQRPEAQKGKHDDAVLALSLALYVRDILVRDVPVGFGQAPEPTVSKEDLEDIRRQIALEDYEDWLLDEELDTSPKLLPEELELLPGMMKYLQSRQRALLNEFGWTLLLPIWLVPYSFIA